jgi:hypothetical protein
MRVKERGREMKREATYFSSIFIGFLANRISVILIHVVFYANLCTFIKVFDFNQILTLNTIYFPSQGYSTLNINKRNFSRKEKRKKEP